MLICPRCDTLFMPKNKNQRLCGKRDCRLEDQRHQMLERNRLHFERHGVRYEDRYKVVQSCIDCGAEFKARPSHGSTRCRPCGRTYGLGFGSAAGVAANIAQSRSRKQLVLAGPRRRADTLAYRLAADQLIRAAAGSRPRARIWVDATCRVCGERFLCMRTNDLPVYCSRRCLRRSSKVRRRAMAAGGTPVTYSRIKIFERDKWICRLCGKRVKRQARVPDPKAPVIDHVVPLSAGAENGGVDAPWNVQCAHFLCNSIKRANYAAPALF